MPRPPRRTRAIESRTVSTSTTATATATTAKAATTATGRRTRRSQGVSAEATTADDIASIEHTRGRRAGSDERPATNTATTKAKRAARGTSRHAAHGPDASGLDMLDDDSFADLDTNLGDLDDLNDLDDLDNDLDAFGGNHDGANTSHSTETSSLFNVGLFRRGRPRQSSIHSRDDAPIRPSSRSVGPATPSLGSTLSLGTFKRRRREPSILGANRRRHPHQASSRQASHDHDGHETSSSELEGGHQGLTTSDLDEPPSMMATGGLTRQESQRSSRVSSRASLGAPSSAQSIRVATADASSLSEASNTTSLMLLARTRAQKAGIKQKRKSNEGPRNDDDDVAPPSKRKATHQLSSDADILPSIEVSSTTLSSPPPISSLPSSGADRRRYATPGGPDDQVMAPPASSGSESDELPIWPSLKGLAHGPRRGGRATAAAVATRKTPDLVEDDDGASDLSSPPSLTHSPNYGHARSRATSAKRRPAAKQNVAPLTTAALAALLPQRRRRARDGGVDDAGDELDRSALLSEDDDELAHYGALRRGRSVSRAAVQTATTTRSMRSTVTATETETAATSKAKRAVRRMYGSRSFSDKENEETNGTDGDDSTFRPLPDDAFADETTERPVAAGARYFGAELEKASKKFQEVDKWTLAYESVSRSSSPIGAR